MEKKKREGRPESVASPLRRAWLTALLFELIFQLLTAGLLRPLFFRAADLLMRLTGYTYITAENALRFFLHPASLLFLAGTLFFVGLHMSVGMGGIARILGNAGTEDPADAVDAFHFSILNSLSFLTDKSRRPVIGLLIVLYPLFNLSVFPYLLQRLMLTPGDILTFISGNGLRLALSVILPALYLIFFFRNLYVFPCMALEKCSFRRAAERSRRMHARHLKTDAAAWTGLVLILYAAYALILFGGIFAAVAAARLVNATPLGAAVPANAVMAGSELALFAASLLDSPIGTIGAVLLYLKHSREDAEAAGKRETEEVSAAAGDTAENTRRGAGKRIIYAAEFILILAGALTSGFYMFRRLRNHYNPRIEYLHETEVTAHRGASAYCPENTMAAFRLAIEQGADWIELDVQESADGVLFVMHDRSLKRTTGVSGTGSDFTFEELSRLDAGSWFSPAFAGERIPSLSEVIDLAAETGVRLNIEIKPVRKDGEQEKHLADLLREKGFVEQCVVTSQSYDAVRTIKETAPEIRTVYVLTAAHGRIEELSAADDFSIRYDYINELLVERIHNAGKQVYAWTVNSRKRADPLIDLRVDCLITDHVPIIRSCIADRQSGRLMDLYARWVDRLLTRKSW